jgi:hypothetical protein
LSAAINSQKILYTLITSHKQTHTHSFNCILLLYFLLCFNPCDHFESIDRYQLPSVMEVDPSTPKQPRRRPCARIRKTSYCRYPLRHEKSSAEEAGSQVPRPLTEQDRSIISNNNPHDDLLQVINYRLPIQGLLIKLLRNSENLEFYFNISDQRTTTSSSVCGSAFNAEGKVIK